MTSIPRPAAVPAVVAGECVSSDLEVMVGEVVARSPWGRFGRVFGPDTDGEAVVSEEELLARLADAEGLITQLSAAQGRLLLELRERRLATQRQETGPEGHTPGSCTRGCCDPDGWMGLEVAQALAVSERQVSTRLDTAQRLVPPHAATRCGGAGAGAGVDGDEAGRAPRRARPPHHPRPAPQRGGQHGGVAAGPAPHGRADVGADAPPHPRRPGCRRGGLSAPRRPRPPRLGRAAGWTGWRP